MGDCEKTINVEYPNEEPCELTSADCVIISEGLSYLGVEVGENVTLVISKMLQSLMNARNRLEDIEGLIKKVKVTLSPTQLINLGTPVEIIPKPGVGKVIKVISAFSSINFGTISFDSNELNLSYSDGASIFNQTPSFLSATASKIETALVTNREILENKAVEAIGTNSVSSGDGTVEIYITYEVIEL